MMNPREESPFLQTHFFLWNPVRPYRDGANVPYIELSEQASIRGLTKNAEQTLTPSVY